MTLKDKCAFLEERVKRLNEIGLALSREDDTNVIFELIMEEAKDITHSDGRTLYMKSDNGKTMDFKILRTDSMNIVMGGTSDTEITFPSVQLYNNEGKANMNNINTYVAHTGKTLNIKDAYKEEGFDFSGTRSIDKQTGYRSRSFLNVPLKNHEDEIIGVIQLLNSIDQKTNKVQPFTIEMQEFVESLASQGAVVLTNKRLIEQQKKLFEAFIKLIATAIDKKSSYTGGHCERVPKIAMLLADAVKKNTDGKYKDFSMTEDERYELYIASWLHDCGKVATPTHIVDKATKLETITDRIKTVDTRFEVLKRDIEISMLKKQIQLMKNGSADNAINKIKLKYGKSLNKMNDDREFIRKTNRGGEFMEEDAQKRVADIGNYKWALDGIEIPFLDEEEVRNLQIAKGTLLPEERDIINEHIVITIDMLETLPYPNKLKNVPEFAGGHHEKLNGTGYPKGLKDEEMSIQAKIMAIADIYEALTAKDRPYKEGKKLSEAIEIMDMMKKNHEIDTDLFEIFIKKGVYKEYADRYLDADQIDEVDEASFLGQ